MKFEHLIEVNNLSNPTIVPLSRQELWRGLLLRAYRPTLFMPHLDSCDIFVSTDVMIARSLKYGEIVIEDRVTFLDEQQVRYHVHAQRDFTDSTMTATIEEPQPGALFVRFEYEDGSGDGGPDAMYNDFRRSAYKEADIDTIHLIRQFAKEGRIDALLGGT